MRATPWLTAVDRHIGLTQDTAQTERSRALLILFVMPLFFSTNIVFGRAAIDAVEPFTLAFLRWGFTTLILLPFVAITLKRDWPQIRKLGLRLLVMGFLGMWVCGALVYLALKYTSATNGTLIYTSSPVLIILIEWAFRGRAIGVREALGVTIAFVGVVVIVAKGSFARLLDLEFNPGDLIFVGTAISWAIYSVGLRTPALSGFQTFPLFALLAGAGALLLAPFALVETIWLQSFPHTVSAWTNITGIVLISSLLAFSAFQYGVKIVGSSLAGVFLYLLPVYGVTLAILFLGEDLAAYHGWGILLVLGGVVMATVPATVFKGKRPGRGAF